LKRVAVTESERFYITGYTDCWPCGF